MKHLLSIEQLSREEIERILRRTGRAQNESWKDFGAATRGTNVGFDFFKTVHRTRVSFDVGIANSAARRFI